MSNHASEEVIVPKHTNDIDLTECEKDVVFAIDVLDVNRRLVDQKVPFAETLKMCGFLKNKSAYLQIWVNKRRAKAGKPQLSAGTITSGTTIEGVVQYVC
jgi:hypothetical protein